MPAENLTERPHYFSNGRDIGRVMLDDPDARDGLQAAFERRHEFETAAECLSQCGVYDAEAFCQGILAAPEAERFTAK